MNILFLSLGKFESINQRGISPDLLREFIKNGHKVVVLAPASEHDTQDVIREKNSIIIKVQTGKIQKTNIIKKGINTVLLEPRYIDVIRRRLGKIHFDMVLYPTPPITYAGAVKYIKKRDGARSYLLLKDIFPQNAVDIGMMSKTSFPKKYLYRYFRKKEKELYALSDHIGCMSQANVDYLLKNNPEVDVEKVEVCPNSVDPIDMSVNYEKRCQLREKYDIPSNKVVFVYGGNLGKPQGIPFLIECLKKLKNSPDAYFLIVGDGTEFGKIQQFIDTETPKNVKLMSRLPKDDYDAMVGSCDVGLIFLDHRFTIPNFPSRLLSYMQAKLPVIACTDTNTDIGKSILDGSFGWWCESNDVEAFSKIVDEAVSSDLKRMGNQGFQYLTAHYDVKDSYTTIVRHM